MIKADKRLIDVHKFFINLIYFIIIIIIIMIIMIIIIIRENKVLFYQQ